MRKPARGEIPVGLVVAGRIQGGWAWSMATPNETHVGVVHGDNLAAADRCIAWKVQRWLPPRVSAYRISAYVSWNPGRRKAIRHEFQTKGVNLPVTEAILRGRWWRPGDLTPNLDHLIEAARARLPSTACVHPETPRVSVPKSNPFEVACDGSFRPADNSLKEARAAWGYVTGAGWALALPVRAASSLEAEFAAYCHALANYPDGTEVTILTDARKAQAILLRIISEEITPDEFTKIVGRHPKDREVLALFSLANLHTHRLGVQARWVPRNTHPLQDLADTLCGRAAGRRPRGGRF